MPKESNEKWYNKYFLRNLPEWLMLIIIIIFSFLAYTISIDTNRIADKTNQLEEIYVKIIESQMLPKIEILEKPDCSEINFYKKINVRLINIAELPSKCEVRLKTHRLYCADSEVYNELLGKLNEWESKKFVPIDYEDYVKFVETYGKQEMYSNQKTLLKENPIDFSFTLFADIRHNYPYSNFVAGFEISYTCQEETFNQSITHDVIKCDYNVDGKFDFNNLRSYIPKNETST